MTRGEDEAAIELLAKLNLPPWAATVPDGPAALHACDHHWVSEHVPGHLLYWVRQCSLCHEVNWDDLDEQVRELLAAGERAESATRTGGDTPAASPHTPRTSPGGSPD